MEFIKKIQPIVFTSYDEGLSGTDSFLKWWSQIQSSKHWHYAIFYTLCAAYALISTVALVYYLSLSLSHGGCLYSLLESLIYRLVAETFVKLLLIG